MLLLLKFICSCTCTRTIAKQWQHETVTAATTTTQSNLQKLLSVEDVIFPIQQLHMNTSSENMSSLSFVHVVCCVWGGKYEGDSGCKLECALFLGTWSAINDSLMGGGKLEGDSGTKLEGDSGSKLEGDSGLAVNLTVTLAVNLKMTLAWH